MASITPSERLRLKLDDALRGVADEHDPVEAIGRLGARLILQQALEDELSDYLGRARYERTGQPTTHRNGYEPLTVKTTSGPLALERPQRARSTSRAGCSARASRARTRSRRS